jgi:hypothetical protein
MSEIWHLEDVTAMVTSPLALLWGCVRLYPGPALEVRVMLFSLKDWGLSEHDIDTSQVPRQRWSLCHYGNLLITFLVKVTKSLTREEGLNPDHSSREHSPSP